MSIILKDSFGVNIDLENISSLVIKAYYNKVETPNLDPDDLNDGGGDESNETFAFIRISRGTDIIMFDERGKVEDYYTKDSLIETCVKDLIENLPRWEIVHSSSLSEYNTNEVCKKLTRLFENLKESSEYLEVCMKEYLKEKRVFGVVTGDEMSNEKREIQITKVALEEFLKIRKTKLSDLGIGYKDKRCCYQKK